jgi:hypothetical protein
MTNGISSLQHVKKPALILAGKFVIFCQEYFAVLVHTVVKGRTLYLTLKRANRRSFSAAVLFIVILVISDMEFLDKLLYCFAVLSIIFDLFALFVSVGTIISTTIWLMYVIFWGLVEIF